MHEIEVKILEVDRKNLEKILLEHGAQQVFSWSIQSFFYGNETQKQIRLRRAWIECFLTYKIPKLIQGYASNQEYEILISSLEEMQIILEEIWFKKYRESRKQRISYMLWSIRFDFDTYPGIPEFLEIEAETPENVLYGIKLLWYSLEQTHSFWEMGLRKHYSTK
jgi:adenylate cyclase class 2